MVFVGMEQLVASCEHELHMSAVVSSAKMILWYQGTAFVLVHHDQIASCDAFEMHMTSTGFGWLPS